MHRRDEQALTSTLLEAGLVDELLLIVYPVLPGTGKRFFAEATAAQTFTLVDSQALPSGVVLTTYRAPTPLPKAAPAT